MKTQLTYVAVAFACLLFFKLSAQDGAVDSPATGGEYFFPLNSSAEPCISAAQYEVIEKRCADNSKLYIHTEQNLKVAATALNWPLKAKNGFMDCSFYFISAHVDQDKATTTFKDYNCGTISYDGHKGTDIAIGPFGIHKMDNDQVEVIAAAAGTIIDKHDGEFDKNCVGVGSNLTANYVIVQHADGSCALYWHMKSGKLTSKIVGQTVSVGEYLGVVGSSGSSSGPHLHFEVWSGNTSATVVDPFYASCNTLNGATWWASQKTYTEPAILKASVHTTDVVIPPCPGAETLNDSNSYTIPFQGSGLTPGYAKFYIFMRNETMGTAVNMEIIGPGATVFTSWTRNCANSYNASYYGYSKKLPTTAGTYTFQATYNGVTCAQDFVIINPSGVGEINSGLFNMHIFPNPFKSDVTLQFDQALSHAQLSIYNGQGQIIKSVKNISGREIRLNRDDLASGFYYLQLSQDSQLIGKQKLVITD